MPGVTPRSGHTNARDCPALESRLFGNSLVECNPVDSEIRQGPMIGVLHRGCKPLRHNSLELMQALAYP